MVQPENDQFNVIVVLEEDKADENNSSRLHQCLLMLFDSPLNHSKHLEVYIRLLDKRLVKLHRELRLPRTFKRFEQLWSNFLRGDDLPLVETQTGQAKLLKIIGKNIDAILPQKSVKVRIGNFAPRLKHAEYFPKLLDESAHKRFVVFITFGPVDFNFLGDSRESEYPLRTVDRQSNEDLYSISRYPLSPSLTCVKIASAFENKLEIF